ncbi:hypothetical protein [Neptuniibacter marinus]|uniref:hypothetical protein n=1 Tax=Neptuniibacter marinus TaxID=1806670 RepID=UPI003B59FDBA
MSNRSSNPLEHYRKTVLPKLPDFSKYTPFFYKNSTLAAIKRNRRAFEALRKSQDLLNSNAQANINIKKIEALTNASKQLDKLIRQSIKSSEISSLITEMHASQRQHALMIQALDLKNFPLQELLDGTTFNSQIDLSPNIETIASLDIVEAEQQVETENKAGGDFLKLSPDIQKALINYFLQVILPLLIGIQIGHQGTEELKREHIKTRQAIERSAAKTSQQVNSLLRDLSTLQKESIRNYRVTTSERGLHLRELARKDSESIVKLPIRSLIYILDDSDRPWLLVEAQINGRNYIGWVYRRYTKSIR